MHRDTYYSFPVDRRGSYPTDTTNGLNIIPVSLGNLTTKLVINGEEYTWGPEWELENPGSFVLTPTIPWTGDIITEDTTADHTYPNDTIGTGIPCVEPLFVSFRYPSVTITDKEKDDRICELQK